MKTLNEYIEMYEKHTGEKFEFNYNFSFFYSPAHGFCEYSLKGDSLYIWQMCGDGRFWLDIAIKTCVMFGLKSFASFVIRKPKPFIRFLGFRITEALEKDGCKKYICVNDLGEKLTATQYGDRYIFTREVNVDARQSKKDREAKKDV